MQNPSGISPPPRQRMLGLDIARTCAILGMVFINYMAAVAFEVRDGTFIGTMYGLSQGRAAALFVTIAGVGASLASAKARVSGDKDARRAAQWRLASRAGVLFIAGWLLHTVWPGDILHYYGVFLACGAVMLFAGWRTIIAVSAASVLTFLTLFTFFDPSARWEMNGSIPEYQGLFTPVGFIRNLFFDGFHPVLMWVVLYFSGMLLGRLDLRAPRVRRTILMIAAPIALSAELIALNVFGARWNGAGGELDHLGGDQWRWYFSANPMPPGVFYLAAAGATAWCVIACCIALGEKLSPKLAATLGAIGTHSLTHYIGHVLIGLGIYLGLGLIGAGTQEQVALGTVLYWLFAVVFSLTWRRWFSQGPAEVVFRRISGWLHRSRLATSQAAVATDQQVSATSEAEQHHRSST